MTEEELIQQLDELLERTCGSCCLDNPVDRAKVARMVTKWLLAGKWSLKSKH